ncbi:hypothetical protein FACS1894137_17630 [Spirochaetia bacterium]|nr:hypothetical protein FACS1894137_17630 [Spirochaetia bacterium]
MRFINKYMRNLHPYKIASHKIWDAAEEERSTVLKLDWNESTISPSPKVKERLLKLVQNSDIYNLYPITLNKELLRLLSLYVGLPEENLSPLRKVFAKHKQIV